MPGLFTISSTFFVSLLTRLGVKPPPSEGFSLINTVQPVSIVDIDTTLPVVTTSMLLGVPGTAGPLAAPAAGTLLATTGALNAGNYNVTVWVGLTTAAGAGDFIIARRNAADAADIWRQQNKLSDATEGTFARTFQASLSLNERFSVRVAAGGAANIESNIWYQLVT